MNNNNNILKMQVMPIFPSHHQEKGSDLFLGLKDFHLQFFVCNKDKFIIRLTALIEK